MGPAADITGFEEGGLNSSAIVYCPGGSLPVEAQLHLRQLSLFSMVCHLPEDPLSMLSMP